MSKLKESIQRENRLAQGSIVTVNDLKIVTRQIKFPEDVSGLNILEVGGACSIVTLQLRAQGANALAVDSRYDNFKTLREAGEQTLERVSKLKGRVNRIRTEEVLTNFNYFFDSLKDIHSRPYVAALAGWLSFQEGVFDFGFSLSCISPFLIQVIRQDTGLFTKAVLESVRVLKPRGQFQIVPWPDRSLDWDPEDRQLAKKTVDNLSKEGISCVVEPTGFANYKRLTITKPR